MEIGRIGTKKSRTFQFIKAKTPATFCRRFDLRQLTTAGTQRLSSGSSSFIFTAVPAMKSAFCLSAATIRSRYREWQGKALIAAQGAGEGHGIAAHRRIELPPPDSAAKSCLPIFPTRGPARPSAPSKRTHPRQTVAMPRLQSSRHYLWTILTAADKA